MSWEQDVDAHVPRRDFMAGLHQGSAPPLPDPLECFACPSVESCVVGPMAIRAQKTSILFTRSCSSRMRNKVSSLQQVNQSQATDGALRHSGLHQAQPEFSLACTPAGLNY